ncbi:hypothetical protein MRB53_015488 [Persea americana]|uniref:Uncharacterized protein n=1 Tax=Persea americana TaxID=3435 RepID=A0ACC2LZL7_PERAE|nr:hypothetical protein MRB53_015488 [Persea americana]
MISRKDPSLMLSATFSALDLFLPWYGKEESKYGRKLIGATDPQKSEPETIRVDLAVVVGRTRPGDPPPATTGRKRRRSPFSGDDGEEFQRRFYTAWWL